MRVCACATLCVSHGHVCVCVCLTWACLCVCVCVWHTGLKDGVAPSPEDSNALLDIIPGALPDITRDMVQAVLTERTQRAMAYT